MLITILGPDRFRVDQSLRKYLNEYCPPDDPMGDLNLTRLDGSKITPGDLTRAVQSVGFFADRRVVVVDGLLSRFAGKGAGDEADAPPKGRARQDAGLTGEFADALAEVPENTVLILVERNGANRNGVLAKAATRYGRVEEHIVPRGAALERWVEQYGKQAELRVTPGAQARLAATLADPLTIAGELDKLALYVGPGGTVDETVLRDASFTARADDVFELTNAVARRDTKGALVQLHRLIDGGTAPEGILPALAWQVRTLIQVRDMLDRRVPERQMPEQAGLSEFVIRKSIPQARDFTMTKLLDIHSRLLKLDQGVKTGQADADLTIDAFVVSICRD